MAKVVVEQWHCDRCGKVLPAKPGISEAADLFHVSAGFNGAWAGGKVIEWNDLCALCNSVVGQQINAMKKAGDEMRHRLSSTPLACDAPEQDGEG